MGHYSKLDLYKHATGSSCPRAPHYGPPHRAALMSSAAWRWAAPSFVPGRQERARVVTLLESPSGSAASETERVVMCPSLYQCHQRRQYLLGRSFPILKPDTTGTPTNDGHSSHPMGWCTASSEARSNQSPSQGTVCRESCVPELGCPKPGDEFVTNGPFTTPTADQSGNKSSTNVD